MDLVYGRGFAKYTVARSLGGNRYVFRHGATPGVMVHWIIDREGCFRRVKTIGYRRTWARALARARVADLVLIEVEIEPGAHVSAAELLKELHDLKAPASFATARHLRSFLKEKEPAEPFDESMFRQFWEKHGPRLEEEEWRRQIP